MDSTHEPVVDEGLVSSIEQQLNETFPRARLTNHAVACKAAEAVQAYRLEHINDSPGMEWMEDPDDDDPPDEYMD